MPEARAAAIERAMTVTERRGFLDAVTSRNPRLDGAHVADVLSMLFDMDAHLDVTEPLYERLKVAGLDDDAIRLRCDIAVMFAELGPVEPAAVAAFATRMELLAERERTYTMRSGRVLTEDEIERLVAEAVEESDLTIAEMRAWHIIPRPED